MPSRAPASERAASPLVRQRPPVRAIPTRPLPPGAASGAAGVVSLGTPPPVAAPAEPARPLGTRPRPPVPPMAPIPGRRDDDPAPGQGASAQGASAPRPGTVPAGFVVGRANLSVRAPHPAGPAGVRPFGLPSLRRNVCPHFYITGPRGALPIQAPHLLKALMRQDQNVSRCQLRGGVHLEQGYVNDVCLTPRFNQCVFYEDELTKD